MSPRTKKQFEEIRAKSIAAIKEAALELFATDGYQATPIARIAKKANLSKGLIYNYFESKEDLLQQILLGYMEVVEEMMTGFFDGKGTAEERFRDLINNTFDIFIEDIHHWKLYLSLAFQPKVLENFQKLSKQMQEMGYDTTEAVLKEMGIDSPYLEARFLAAALDGIFLHYISTGEAYPLEEMKEFIFKKYCK